MGNIITGFDNYAKGTSSSVAAQRRRTGLIEQNRVFSRSSLSYNPLNVSLHHLSRYCFRAAVRLQ